MKRKKALAYMLVAAMSLNMTAITAFAEEQQDEFVVQNEENTQKDVDETVAIKSLEIKDWDDRELNTTYPLGTFSCVDYSFESKMGPTRIKIHYDNGAESEWQMLDDLKDSGALLRVRDSEGNLVETAYEDNGLPKILQEGSYQMNLEIDKKEYKLYDFCIKPVEDCVTQTLTLNNKVNTQALYYKNNESVTKIVIPDNAIYSFHADCAPEILQITDAQGNAVVSRSMEDGNTAKAYLNAGSYYLYDWPGFQGLSMEQQKVEKIELSEKPEGTQNLYMQDEFSNVDDFWDVHSRVHDALKYRITYQDGNSEEMNYEQFGKLSNYEDIVSFWKVDSPDSNEWLFDNQTGLYYEVLMLKGEGYTWTDPLAEIPIYVSKRFPDVPEGRWDYPYVGKISAVEIMTGMGNGEFNSTGTLARAQFATTLYRMSGSPEIEYTDKFKDISEGEWYTNAILWANKAGVANGYANGNFGPGDKINREQMATMMYNYAKSEGYDISARKDLNSFADGKYVSSYAKNAMEWAVANGIITGKDNETRLDPQGSANRGECAAILMRFLEKYVY